MPSPQTPIGTLDLWAKRLEQIRDAAEGMSLADEIDILCRAVKTEIARRRGKPVD